MTERCCSRVNPFPSQTDSAMLYAQQLFFFQAVNMCHRPSQLQLILETDKKEHTAKHSVASDALRAACWSTRSVADPLAFHQLSFFKNIAEARNPAKTTTAEKVLALLLGRSSHAFTSVWHSTSGPRCNEGIHLATVHDDAEHPLYACAETSEGVDVVFETTASFGVSRTLSHLELMAQLLLLSTALTEGSPVAFSLLLLPPPCGFSLRIL